MWFHIPNYFNRSPIYNLISHQYNSVLHWKIKIGTKAQCWGGHNREYRFESSHLLEGCCYEVVGIEETVTSARNQNLMMWEFKVIPPTQAIIFNMCSVSYNHFKEDFLPSALNCTTQKHPDKRSMYPFLSSNYNCRLTNWAATQTGPAIHTVNTSPSIRSIHTSDKPPQKGSFSNNYSKWTISKGCV